MEPKNSSISNDREPCKTTAASSAHARPNRKSTASSAMVMKPNGKSAVSSAILKKPNASTAVSSAHDDQVMFFRDVSLGPTEAEMILIDEEGTVIQGFVPAGRVGTYELEPGSVYKLRNFFGSRNKARYRVTDHSATVTFAWNTELKILDNPLVSIHEDRFRFHSYEEFYANCDRKVDLYDYVGHMKLVNGQTITEHTVLDEVDISDKRHLCVHVQTHEFFVLMKLYLWDKAASDFCVKFKSYGSTPSVLLVTTVNPKHLGGTLALTSMASSRVFMDSDVQPSRDYLGWLSSNSDIANKINEEVRSFSPTSSRKLLRYSSCSIFVAWFECTTTIDDVVQGSPWYYISCGGCNSKAVKGPTSLICNNKKCGKSVVTGVTQYLTRILVYDKSEQAVFVVLSDAGKELTGKHASELVASYFETQTITVTKIFPPEAPQPIAPLEEHAVPTTSGDILESGSDGVRKASETLESDESKRCKSG
ncbi:BnaC04g24970D [Brassica napus]|uniref:BnaC04g24970D protein n=1 Tax=Brassica napus TaxID=3708 RepID=A0A078IKC3_BRANA|nr:BnaC04g24970D [Brassica napus]